MCCSLWGKAYEPEELEIVFRIAKHRREQWYGLLQLGLVLVGIIIAVSGAGPNPAAGMFFGVTVIIMGGLVPRPFFANFGRVGDAYLVFDDSRRAVVLVRGRMFNREFKKKDLCAYPRFRGLAYFKKTNEILILIKGHDSYVTTAGDHFDQDAVTEISLWWYQNYGSDKKVMHFGPTMIPLDEGIRDNVDGDIAVDYQFWKKTKRERGADAVDRRSRVQKRSMWSFGKGLSMDLRNAPANLEANLEPESHSESDSLEERAKVDNPWQVTDNV